MSRTSAFDMHAGHAGSAVEMHPHQHGQAQAQSPQARAVRIHIQPAASSQENAMKSDSAGYYAWEVWPGRSRPVMLFGRVFLIGRNTGVLSFHVAFLCANVALFCWGVAQHISIGVTVGACVLGALTLTALSLCTLTEPGIVPRRRMEDYPNSSHGSVGNGPLYPSPTGVMNGIEVPLKWCRTCCIYRPLRASHCRECDACVEGFDHHCPFIANCVGQRNYRHFVVFLLSILMLDLYVLGSSLYLLAHDSMVNSFEWAVSTHPLSLVETLIAFVFLWCLGSLFGYHFWLVVHHLTTNEFIKQSRADRAPAINNNAYPAPLSTPNVQGQTPPPPHPNAFTPRSNFDAASSSLADPVESRRTSVIGGGPDPDQPACWHTWAVFLCAPTPPSQLDLERWMPGEPPQNQAPMPPPHLNQQVVTYPQQTSYAYSHTSVQAGYPSSQLSSQVHTHEEEEARRLQHEQAQRREYDDFCRAQQQHQQLQQSQLHPDELEQRRHSQLQERFRDQQRRLTADPILLAAHTPGPFYSGDSTSLATPSAATYTPSRPGRASLPPLYPTTSGGAVGIGSLAAAMQNNPSATAAARYPPARDDAIHQTRARTAEVQREIQMLEAADSRL